MIFSFLLEVNEKQIVYVPMQGIEPMPKPGLSAIPG